LEDIIEPSRVPLEDQAAQIWEDWRLIRLLILIGIVSLLGQFVEKLLQLQQNFKRISKGQLQVNHTFGDRMDIDTINRQMSVI
jgi:hypothetical protein